MKVDAIVLGAGMVGVSTALALQSSGRVTALIDRQKPGREASFGNAGIIQAEAVKPYGFPMSVRTLASVALGRSSAVRWNIRGIAGSLGPLGSYFVNSLPSSHANIAKQYGELIRHATSDHQALIEAAKAEHLIRRDGFIEAFRSEGNLDAAIKEAEWSQSAFGVGSTILDSDELASTEPGLRERFSGALHWSDSWSCKDPGALVSLYATHFQSRGGQVLRGDASSLKQNRATWQVATARGYITGDCAVVAMGAWSPGLLRRFGYRFPMILKRGYHQHVTPGSGPQLPFVDADNAVVFSPMNDGLRVLTGAEITPMDSPVNKMQIDRATALAETLFGASVPADNPVWHGTRPCTPNMLPVVAKAKNHHGLWFNFGHGHQGFTLGPTTARILASKMDGLADKPSVP